MVLNIGLAESIKEIEGESEATRTSIVSTLQYLLLSAQVTVSNEQFVSLSLLPPKPYHKSGTKFQRISICVKGRDRTEKGQPVRNKGLGFVRERGERKS